MLPSLYISNIIVISELFKKVNYYLTLFKTKDIENKNDYHFKKITSITLKERKPYWGRQYGFVREREI
jgi:hypothetical protein